MNVITAIMLLDAAATLMNTADKLVERAKSERDAGGRAEWTPEQEAEFTAKLERITSAPHWQPRQ